MSSNITTGKVRFSFMYLFSPRKSKDDTGEEKYSVTLLIPKNDVVTYNTILAGIEEAKQEGITGAFKGTVPPMLAFPLYDGDGVRPSTGEPFGPECRGCWVINASNKIQPSLVDINLQPILQQSQLYSGCYGRASIRFFPYATGKKGIGCSLNSVQKLEDGEALGGMISPEEAFGGGNVYGNISAPGVWPNGQAAQQGYPMQNQMPVQPQYQQPVPVYQQPQVLQYQQPTPQHQQPVQQYQQSQYQQPPIDPITGVPYTGGVMGI